MFLRITSEKPVKRMDNRFGVNTTKRPSRFWLSVFYDLLCDLQKYTVITSSEVELPIKVAGLLSGVLLLSNTVLLGFFLWMNGLVKIPVWWGDVIVNSAFGLLASILLSVSYIFLWEMGIRGVHTSTQLKLKIKESTKKIIAFILFGVLVPALISILLLGR